MIRKKKYISLVLNATKSQKIIFLICMTLIGLIYSLLFILIVEKVYGQEVIVDAGKVGGVRITESKFFNDWYSQKNYKEYLEEKTQIYYVGAAIQLDNTIVINLLKKNKAIEVDEITPLLNKVTNELNIINGNIYNEKLKYLNELRKINSSFQKKNISLNSLITELEYNFKSSEFNVESKVQTSKFKQKKIYPNNLLIIALGLIDGFLLGFFLIRLLDIYKKIK